MRTVPPLADPPIPVAFDQTADAATLRFDGPVPAGTWLCAGMPCVESCVGYLPGDVDADGGISLKDHSALLTALQASTPPEVQWCDIDRSGACTPADLLRWIDLYNGAGAYEPIADRTLPPCPAATP